MKTARKCPGKAPKVAVAAAALVPLSLTVQDCCEPSHDAIYKACAKSVGVEVKINHIPGAGLISKVRELRGLGRGHGHRGARLHPGRPAADLRSALHRGRRHQRSDQMRKEHA